MEREVIEAELVLPTHMKFKKIQMYDKYPKGQARGRHWKHLKQIIQAENYDNYPPHLPTSKSQMCQLPLYPTLGYYLQVLLSTIVRLVHSKSTFLTNSLFFPLSRGSILHIFLSIFRILMNISKF
ncbi:uncharacterized protein LOC107873551 isoform X3 [Capsicum annuum]|uniref:uncharacterized protein LOC107873551 isoform X3 n=1 Tax=Capsicum annuum TaxID=4072 RepID=UPI0007BF877B|nr:uncharacterized protein LOC107873551 isoform X3 [Capsicum annuum]